MYYAHIKNRETQTLKEHLLNVANMAAEFSSSFHSKEIGYNAGLLHDIGKYSKKFQERIRGKNIQVDHSTAGMKEVMTLYKNTPAIAKILSYVIAGHHAGIPDAGSLNYAGSLEYRMKKDVEPYDDYRNEIKIKEINQQTLSLKLSDKPYFSLYTFIKMVFSCLVDADFLDTEYFMNRDNAIARSGYDSLESLYKLFKAHMRRISNDSESSAINAIRSEIYQECLEKADSETGLFSLTVPTGGGKTLSSIGFALKHAIRNKLKRIIYVIPYTSIIEQNAQIYKDIFGEKNVLEHHSNYDFETTDISKLDETKLFLKLASENWDIPIVVTTNVQFFESFFSNKSSKTRKLHNISKSVVILDEAQMLPVRYLKACIHAISELKRNYNTTAVLCTATQPNIDNPELLGPDMAVQEIIEQPQRLYKVLRRTRIKRLGDQSDEELAEILRNQQQVLCVVNRKAHAANLFDKLDDKDNDFHLSTRLCAKHRKDIIEKIKGRLKAGEKCRVITTQLIEAGVDVDFPVVYRALSGIDSIAQAAGRCNREGKREIADVFVFYPTEEYAQPPGELKINASTAESIFRNYADPLSIEAIQKYFELLYDTKNIDTKDILKKIKRRCDNLDFPFSEIAADFKLIENRTTTVITQYDKESERLIGELKNTPYPHSTIRKLQAYTVELYEHEFKALSEAGGIESIENEEVFYCISDMNRFYDKSKGLIVDNDHLRTDFLSV